MRRSEAFKLIDGDGRRERDDGCGIVAGTRGSYNAGRTLNRWCEEYGYGRVTNAWFLLHVGALSVGAAGRYGACHLYPACLAVFAGHEPIC